jgi:hypothetical protein
MQHMQAGAVGDNLDCDRLLLGLVVFEDILGVVERQVHDPRVVVIDMDGDPVGRPICIFASLRGLVLAYLR